MQSWLELKSVLYNNFKVVEDTEKYIAVEIFWDDERSQRVIISPISDGEFAVFRSPVGTAKNLNLQTLCEAASLFGFIKEYEWFTMVHSVHVASSTPEQVVEMCSILAQHADEFEERFRGTDVL